MHLWMRENVYILYTHFYVYLCGENFGCDAVCLFNTVSNSAFYITAVYLRNTPTTTEICFCSRIAHIMYLLCQACQPGQESKCFPVSPIMCAKAPFVQFRALSNPLANLPMISFSFCFSCFSEYF